MKFIKWPIWKRFESLTGQKYIVAVDKKWRSKVILEPNKRIF